MKMKTGGGVLPHIIIYMEEKIPVHSTCAQQYLNINLDHSASTVVCVLIYQIRQEPNRECKCNK